MVFNLLKFAYKSGVAIIILVTSVTVCYSSQTDNRGFPVQQSQQGSSFISPNSLTRTPTNTSGSSFVSPNSLTNTSNTSVNYNNNFQNNNFKTHEHGHRHQWYYNNIQPNLYYYNPGLSPYFYYYYPGDDSYYNNSTNYNQTNTQTALPTYDSSSLPDGTWITERDGAIPDKAFVFQIVNGGPTYYCRVQYKYTTYYGVLSPNIGCYIQDDSAIVKFSQYDVLISPN